MFINNFKTNRSTIDYIIADFDRNRIVDKKECFYECVNEKIENLNREYDAKVDKILNFIIIYSDFNNLPVTLISKIIYSMSKVTKAVTKGIMTLLKFDED